MSDPFLASPPPAPCLLLPGGFWVFSYDSSFGSWAVPIRWSRYHIYSQGTAAVCPLRAWDVTKQEEGGLSVGLSGSFRVVLRALKWRGPAPGRRRLLSATSAPQAVSHIPGQASLFPFPAAAGRADGFLETLFVQLLRQSGVRPGCLFCLPDQPVSRSH